jgi:hypothetical protein
VRLGAGPAPAVDIWRNTRNTTPRAANMPGESSGRPLLPQTAQMQSFSFAPPALAPRENQRSESRHCEAPKRVTTD